MYVSHIIAPHSRWNRYLGMTAAMTHTHRGTYNGSPSVCALTSGMRHSKYFLMSNRTFLAQRINREVLSQAKRHKCRILWLGKKIMRFILFCSRFSVTLASPKFLALGNEKKNKFSFCISLVFRNFAKKSQEWTRRC